MRQVDSRIALLLLPPLVIAVMTGLSTTAALRKWPQHKVYLRGLAVLGAIPWCAFMAYYSHRFDGPVYFEFRSWFVSDLAAGLVGALPFAFVSTVKGGRRSALAARWSRVVVPTVAAALLVLVAFAKPALRLLPVASLEERWEDNVCLQSSGSSCGACTIASVLRALQVEVGEREVAEAAFTTTTGTFNWHLARYVRSLGLEATFRAPKSIVEVTPPAMLGVSLGPVGHFVALLDRTETQITIGEPLRGRLVLTPFEFARRYKFEGFALEIGQP